MSKDDLRSEWKEIEKALQTQSSIMFPNIPTFPERSVVAYWPEDKDVSGFLSLAKELAVRPIYAQFQILNQIDLDGMESELRDEEGNLSEDDADFLATANKHLGFISIIQVEWIYERVVHRYVKEAQWHSDLQDRFATLTAEPQEDEITREQKLAQWQEIRKKRELATEDYAQKLAHCEDYAKARGADGQLYICKKMFPDLLSDGTAEDERPTAWNIVNRAKVIFEMEILPGQEKTMARKAHQLIALGKSKIATSAELGIGEKKLARLLAQYSEEE